MFVDVEFLSAFKTAAIRPSSPQSALVSLATVLANAPAIGALRIRVADAYGPESAWARASLVRTEGIPVGAALHRAFQSKKVSLPLLKTLELDAFSDVSPLLRVAPNLERLRLYMSSGFAQLTNAEVVAALRCVPHLRHLVYSPESLRVTTVMEEAEAALAQNIGLEFVEKDFSAELLMAIGKALPELESLDLQTRWHGEEIAYALSDAPITSKVSATLFPHTTKIDIPSRSTGLAGRCSIFTQNQAPRLPSVSLHHQGL